jgi:hypothetical protein
MIMQPSHTTSMTPNTFWQAGRPICDKVGNDDSWLSNSCSSMWLFSTPDTTKDSLGCCLAFWDTLIVFNNPSMAQTGLVLVSIQIWSSRTIAEVRRFLCITLPWSSPSLILFMTGSIQIILVLVLISICLPVLLNLLITYIQHRKHHWSVLLEQCEVRLVG